MTGRIRILAYIYIVMCGGFLTVGIVVCVGLMLSRDPSSGRALEVIGGGFISFSIVYFLPCFLAGLGLLRGKQWARVVIIVLSWFVLFLFPIGTALGGYGLWVLLGRDSKQFATAPALDDDAVLPPPPRRVEPSPGESKARCDVRRGGVVRESPRHSGRPPYARRGSGPTPVVAFHP